MKQKCGILLLTVILLCVALVTAGCGNAGDSASSTGGAMTTANRTTGATKTTATTKPTTTVTTTAPTVSPLVAAYQMDRDLGPVPECGEPAIENRTDRTESADKLWSMENAVKIDSTVLVNCTGTAVAQYQGKRLGDSWKVGASFRPIRNNGDVSQPVCSRLWIADENGRDLFLLTVNNILGQAVEITLEANNGTWLKLYTPQQWIQTDSDVFYFELSREEGSKRLQMLVADHKGELLRYQTTEIRWEDLLDAVAYGGVGVYNSTTEYFYWDIQ